jgi:two-component system, cell cycle sensor histidine kinase PleC
VTTRQSQEADRAAAPDKPGMGQRSVLILVALFLAAFAFATFIQINSRRLDVQRDAAVAQAQAAALIAEQINANLTLAWGAGFGATELALANGDLAARPGDVARAAASARSVRAAAIFDAKGDTVALTDPAEAELAAAAYVAAPAEIWVGAPEMGASPTAPAIVRRIGDHTLVLIIEPRAILPALDADARVLLATPQGEILVGTPAVQADGAPLIQLMLGAESAQHGAAVASDQRGASWALGAARTATGGLRVMTAAPAAGPLAIWFSAVAQFTLLAAAPLAAMGVLYLLMRQNAHRAQLAEAEAERVETHFRLAADGARAGVLEWVASTDVVQLSDQAMQLLGADRDMLPLRQFFSMIVAEDRFSVEEEFRRARKSGMLDAAFRVTRLTGGVAWIEVRGTAIEDASGREPARLIGTIVDVTQRQEAEARVSRLERQLRAAIDSYSGPFALWDSRNRLVLWNQSFAHVFALGPELLRPRVSYEAIAAASAARIRREKNNEADPGVRVVELTTGDWLHLVERRTGDGGLVTLGVDISALKRSEEELARNERRLQEALNRAESQEYKIKALAREADEERQKAEDASRAKSAFLANMSHELRTPLNAVIGFSEIMAKELFGPIGNDQYRQYSGDIYDSGNHLLDLINDILDMAKIEAGKLTLAPRPLDPLVAIEQAVRLTKRRAEEKGLSIVIDAENLPEIEADHRAVKQMLLNLLSNAVKFTDHGAIMVHGRANATGLILRVVDTGCGIPAEHLPRLARPFQQVEQELARNHSGTGLGLSLTKSLAEMHGGKLSITSEVGRGTIVTITLPRVFGGQRSPEATAAE